MAHEGFLQRWSRLKADPAADPAAELPAASAPAPAPVAGAPAPDVSLPTLEDAAQLTADSDYSAFVARGVDAAVRRLAMKKLFADPHFNLIDGLDIYMADYNLPSPVSDEMLASLTHSKNMFARVDQALEAILPPDAEPAPQVSVEQPAPEAPALPSTLPSTLPSKLPSNNQEAA